MDDVIDLMKTLSKRVEKLERDYDDLDYGLENCHATLLIIEEALIDSNALLAKELILNLREKLFAWRPKDGPKSS